MTDRELLDLEDRYPVMTATKEKAIRAAGLGLVRYLQRLNRLMQDPQTLAERPMLVRRWERLMAAKRWGGSRA